MARSFSVFLANLAPVAERIGFSFITPRALPVLAAVTPENESVRRVTRHKRYGLSADSAVHGTNRKLATLLGKVALSLMKRKPAPARVPGGGL